ncbi:hypothetical protein NQ317_018607 [Molorchus minor]|uniref:Uncharacterized protein n=1 Tax=Molorchus minor TaxID=1323400 RepID=A0ABQ9JH07_9CUCU|nr:hypothetical protein NQ317_018607 [Molorchus minor]
MFSSLTILFQESRKARKILYQEKRNARGFVAVLMCSQYFFVFLPKKGISTTKIRKDAHEQDGANRCDTPVKILAGFLCSSSGLST